MNYYGAQVVKTGTPLPLVIDDGGREAAGYRGYAGDCGVRAVAVALELDYKTLYEELAARNQAYHLAQAERVRLESKRQAHLRMARKSARNGLAVELMKTWMAERGWHYVNLAVFGQPPARFSDLPKDRAIVVYLRKHFVAVMHGVIHDTYDSALEYDRPVFGYWAKA